MPKPHSSLSVKTNLLVIPLWGAAAAAFLFFIEPHAPITLGVVGSVLGLVGGIMQHLSLAQATSSFSTAGSLIEVRNALKATPWGSRYIRFLYICKILLLVLSIAFFRDALMGVPFGYAAGYFSLMFVREIVTLRDTFVLQRLSTRPAAA